MNGVQSTTDIYHEKQVKELCALHALNNLFQEAHAFSKADLDGICQDLSPACWINPHRSPLGLGNYDVNIIMAALQRKGYEAIWFDKRKDPESLELNRVFGFILNVPSDFRFRFVVVSLRRRHWIAIRRVNGAYYNLDSKLDSPFLIGQDGELVQYLREQIQNKEKELFIVVSKQTEESRLWLNNNCSVVGNNYSVDSVSDR
ncbi:josephin-like protein isoform X1 [Lycorma delicatula]|uniref:josephin-like protein isoform X1 n=1 Tax=Lycorma delicatula TaxID=130591 RepID=UPI003F517AC1